jgi:hypothetical protein
MIRYRLRCKDGHDFEAWFRSSTDYDRQEARGLLSCALCGRAEVEKTIMAPAVAKPADDTPPPAVSGPVRHPVAAQLPPQLLEMARKIREYVHANSEDVGDRFPEEARRIHYEEAESRGIYGNATLEQARDLFEEGIAVHPMPRLPEDGN